MDKGKAIELLKKALAEIAHLRELHYDNQEFKLWHDKVRDILKASLESDDLGRFSVGSWKIRGIFSDDVYQREYLEEHLPRYETALKSIIQKYEILGFETEPATGELATIADKPKAFIAHGKESIALDKVESFLRALGIESLIVKDQPSLDKTVDDKVNHYLGQADFVIILATGDDEIDGKLQPRGNVIHETGLAQKTHAGKIIYLLEEGAEFPSNIRPKVWEPLNQDNMENVFIYIVKELGADGLGILRVGILEE